jgi:hypothetical protein
MSLIPLFAPAVRCDEVRFRVHRTSHGYNVADLTDSPTPQPPPPPLGPFLSLFLNNCCNLEMNFSIK